MVLILFVVLSLFVPWPWTIAVLVVGLVAECFEVIYGRRLARHMRPKTGVEAMIGSQANVVDACHPNGRVRIDGELWNAVCRDGADAGDSVTVVSQRDLVLEVRPS